MARVVFIAFVATTLLACVFASHLNRMSEEKAEGKRTHDDYYATTYGPYDWSTWSDPNDMYGWSTWDDGSGYVSVACPVSGEVQCISGYCVSLDNVCMGMDYCSAVEDDYLCNSYMYYYRNMKRGMAKKGLNENVDDKKIKERAFNMARKHALSKSNREENKRRIKLEKSLQELSGGQGKAHADKRGENTLADLLKSLARPKSTRRLMKRKRAATA